MYRKKEDSGKCGLTPDSPPDGQAWHTTPFLVYLQFSLKLCFTDLKNVFFSQTRVFHLMPETLLSGRCIGLHLGGGQNLVQNIKI